MAVTLLGLPYLILAQSHTLLQPTTISGSLVKTTDVLSEISISPKLDLDITKKAKPGYHPKGDWPLNSYTDLTAKPNGQDPALQKTYKEAEVSRSLSLNFDGLGPFSVNPADPCLAVGPLHVVQMVNATSGAYLKIWNKDGTVAQNNIYLDGITGINGAGDPIVLYDQVADRWLLSEFASSSNQLVVAISVTNDPTGAYHVYSYTTPDFPDYPKYAVWSNAYFVTTNENGVSPVYALDRNKMLNGDPAPTAQRFTMPEIPSVAFQAATPVGLTGNVLPPAGTPGLLMRMADDAWSTDIPEDRLEMWEFHVDFITPANSVLSGPTNIIVDPFDSNLCGLSNYSCITQPDNGIPLDPLEEILMNKIQYRNFGTHQSIVCNHVTDVDGNDRAGIRWYELRNYGSGWSIYQQSTYAPNTDDASRWMAACAINQDGSIGIAYNVSSSTIYPSIRYTGRMECDPLNQMTLGETTIKDGSSKSNSNRWGDYSCLDVDPIDGSFWFTAAYAKNNFWDTHIGNFNVVDDCFGIAVYAQTDSLTVCSGNSLIFDFELAYHGGYTGTTSFTTNNLPAGLSANFSPSSTNNDGIYDLIISGTHNVASGDYNFEMVAETSTDTSIIQLQFEIEETINQDPILIIPSDGNLTVSYIAYFDWADLINAQRYDLEIAMDSNFTQLIYVESNLTSSELQMTTPLNQNQQYFWRVVGSNICNQSNYSEVRSFTTGAETCNILASGDIPVNIPTSGTPTVISTINISDQGAISNLKINNIDISHTYISDLEIKLISPSGTEITLIDRICGSNDNLFLSFDDTGIDGINCPPTDGLMYLPEDLFSAFANEEVQGLWTLEVQDNYNHDGGSINAWEIEYCIIGRSICPQTLNLIDNPIADGTYESIQMIHSTGTIPANGNVMLRAGMGIELNAGFHSEAGSELEIETGSCTN